MSKQESPYGSWHSPVSSDMLASGVTRLGQIELKEEYIYWSEMHPSEEGRYVIVKHYPDGRRIDLNPPPFNARTRVHEYGGGAYTVNNDTIYFTEFKDQRIYKMILGEEPRPITSRTDVTLILTSTFIEAGLFA